MSGKVWSGIFLILIGLWIWLSNMGYLNFKRDWPLILIVLGIYAVLTAITPSKRSKEKDVRRLLKDLEDGKISTDDVIEELED